ncbi:hypothetical protein M0R45_001994 [Rubus argutus]|uniref:Transmembrane protein n=1 Tax=Rubus argutus TaxID=59490 RepID=A0AAW1VK47_RUBAR
MAGLLGSNWVWALNPRALNGCRLGHEVDEVRLVMYGTDWKYGLCWLIDGLPWCGLVVFDFLAVRFVDWL